MRGSIANEEREEKKEFVSAHSRNGYKRKRKASTTDLQKSKTNQGLRKKIFLLSVEGGGENFLFQGRERKKK